MSETNITYQPYIQLSYRILETLEEFKTIQDKKVNALDDLEAYKSLLVQNQELLEWFPTIKEETFSQLSFLKVDKSEQSYISEILKKISILKTKIEIAEKNIDFINKNCLKGNKNYVLKAKETFNNTFKNISINKDFGLKIAQTYKMIDKLELIIKEYEEEQERLRLDAERKRKEEEERRKLQEAERRRLEEEERLRKEKLRKIIISNDDILYHFPKIKKETELYFNNQTTESVYADNMINVCKKLKLIKENIQDGEDKIWFINNYCLEKNAQLVNHTKNLFEITFNETTIKGVQTAFLQVNDQIDKLQVAITNYEKEEEERRIEEEERLRLEEEERLRSEKQKKLILNILKWVGIAVAIILLIIYVIIPIGIWIIDHIVWIIIGAIVISFLIFKARD